MSHRKSKAELFRQIERLTTEVERLTTNESALKKSLDTVQVIRMSEEAAVERLTGECSSKDAAIVELWTVADTSDLDAEMALYVGGIVAEAMERDSGSPTPLAQKSHVIDMLIEALHQNGIQIDLSRMQRLAELGITEEDIAATNIPMPGESWPETADGSQKPVWQQNIEGIQDECRKLFSESRDGPRCKKHDALECVECAVECIKALAKNADDSRPKYEETYCSQCGQSQGPGDHGYSHCKDHRTAERQREIEVDAAWEWVNDYADGGEGCLDCRFSLPIEGSGHECTAVEPMDCYKLPEEHEYAPPPIKNRSKTMGEIAEMMLEGCMCQWCGEILDGDGYPTLCAGCQDENNGNYILKSLD